MRFKLTNKDSHSLTPVEEMPGEFTEGSKLSVTTELGSAELTITGFGSKRRQAYFKGQSTKVKEVFGSASKESPLKADIDVLE